MSAGDLLLVVLAVVFLHERLVAIEWAGVLLTVFGAAMLAWQVDASASETFSGLRLALLMGSAVLLGALLLLASKRWGRPEVMLALVVGLCFGMGSVLTKALTVQSAGPGQSILTWAVVLNPLLVSVVLANVSGLVLLQAAFQRGRAAVIVPLQLALANALTVATGVLVFGEHVSALRATGIVLIVVGTSLLQFKPVAASRDTA